jgi:hypothetical protein
MQLDKSPGKVFDVILKAAVLKSRVSIDQANRLLEDGFPGPAYVWAVRSVEIFVKEVMLLPLFLEEVPEDKDWDKVWNRARKRVERTFGSDNWEKAIAKVDEVYGPLDPMLTTEGENVWDVWRTVVIRRRGDTVHGKPVAQEVDADEAMVVVGWAEQTMTQLTLRLIAARKHPLSDLFVVAMEQAREAMQAEHDPE